MAVVRMLTFLRFAASQLKRPSLQGYDLRRAFDDLQSPVHFEVANLNYS